MKFVMTQSLCAEGLALLDQAHVDYISADDGDPNHYPQLMQDADALIVRIGKCDAAALACCPQLKVIGRPGIGYDSVDVTQATKLGIPVVVTPGANGRSVAEHTVAMMLSLSKNLVEANNETLQGHWSIRDAHKAFQWEGKTVGIIGLGPIGRETAKICLGIGMKVIGFDSFFSKEQIQSWGVEYCQNKEDLLRTSDIVSVHMPLVEATRNLICASELALMKKTALLINTSRGGIVNEADLLQALTSGQITAAGLDVFAASLCVWMTLCSRRPIFWSRRTPPPRRGKRSFRWRPCAWRDASRFAAGNNGHTWWTRTYMITRAGQIANNTNRSVLYKSTQRRLEVMQLPTAFLHFVIFRMFEFSL